MDGDPTYPGIFAPEGLDPVGFKYGSPMGGDFTLYMEVQSNIVQRTIEYDFVARRLESLAELDPARKALEKQMNELADGLATYTSDPRIASAYVVQDHGGHGMYVGEMVKEVVLGARIPEGGWQHFLAEQGFSEQAIDHIEQIAAQGTAQEVHIAQYLDVTQPAGPPAPGSDQSPALDTPPSPPEDVRPE
jgi:hypothetical protein